MAWAAIAIPIAAQVLGSMGGKKKEEQAPQPAGPAPPGLGELFAMNSAANNSGDNFNTFMIDPTNRGPYG